MFARSLMTLVFMLASNFAYGNPYECYEVMHLEFSNVHGVVELKAEIAGRKRSIAVTIPVDCGEKRAIIPKDDEVVRWIDRALPMEFKAAAIRGDYPNLFAGGYAASAIDDVDSYLTAVWKLDSRKTCSEVEKIDGVPIESCFAFFFYRWRSFYKVK